MKKYILNSLQSTYGIFIILAVIIWLPTWFYMSYTSPIDIQHKYNGIKYQSGYLQSEEQINIEVRGKYVKDIFGKFVDFDGNINVGDKIFTGPLRFNKYRMTSLESNGKFYGMMFINDMFQNLTIEILEPNQNGGHSWSGENGRMISAPCNDRKEAVKISNMLIQKLHTSSIK